MTSQSGTDFPVYCVTEGFKEPDDDVYYLVTADGIFLVKRMLLFDSVTRVNGLPWLERYTDEAGISLKFPKIPYELFMQAVDFLRHIFLTCDRNEAILLIFYSAEEKKFCLDVPKQFAQGAGIPLYRGLASPDGFQKVGDIHSHPGNSRGMVMYSNTDDGDDAEEDGLKIMVAIDGLSFSVLCSFVVGGQRFLLKPDDVIELPPQGVFPKHWTKRVTRQPFMGADGIIAKLQRRLGGGDEQA